MKAADLYRLTFSDQRNRSPVKDELYSHDDAVFERANANLDKREGHDDWVMQSLEDAIIEWSLDSLGINIDIFFEGLK
jgi:hypothetical protein